MIQKIKKYASIFIQVILGLFPAAFWLFGYMINAPHVYFDIDIYSEDTLVVFPRAVEVLIPFCIAVLIICFGIICKKLKLKTMFWTAFFSTTIPIVGYGVMCVCADDSSILCIILLPLLLLLRPFGLMCHETLNNITLTLSNDWFSNRDHSFYVTVVVIALVIAFAIYKSRQRNRTNTGDGSVSCSQKS